MSNGHFTCPVCGYAELEEPPTDVTGSPTYSICPCCGVQFGADDVEQTHVDLRHAWIQQGSPWWSDHHDKPEGWSAQKQMERAGFDLTKPN